MYHSFVLCSFCADVQEVYVWRIFVVCCDCYRRGDSGLGDLTDLHSPVVFRLLKVRQSVLTLPIRHNEVDSLRPQHPINLRDHLIGIGRGPLPTEHRIQSAFINHRIERVLREVHSLHVHLQILEVRAFILILLHHGLGDGRGDVDISDVLVALVEHLLGQPGVAGAHVQDAVLGVYVALQDLFYPVEALVPVEWLWVAAVRKSGTGCSAITNIRPCRIDSWSF
jgi:hypothetical protein